MAQALNQFKQTPEKGMMGLLEPKNTLACKVKSDEATPLVPGQAVKIVNIASKVPVVTAVTVNTDVVFGYVQFAIRKNSFAAGEAVEITSGSDDVMYGEASGAIAPLDSLMPVVVGQKMIVATNGKPISGYALDKAADGELFRFVVQAPSFAIKGAEGAQAANVAALNVTEVTDLATAGGNTYSDAAVNAKIAMVNTALNEIQTTLNAEIAALKAANLQASV